MGNKLVKKKSAVVANLYHKGIKPFPHQIQTLKVLAYKPTKSKLIILPAGSGKTLVALTWANTIKQVVPTKTIIVTENNLIDQVKQDYSKFFVRVDNIDSTKKDAKQKRLKIYRNFVQEETDILVMNYHSLANDITEFIIQCMRIKLRGYKLSLVLDEAENISGETSNITKAVNDLMYYIDFAYGMTASPLKNNLDKTHTILKTLRVPNIPTQEEFYRDYCNIELQSILTLSFNGRRCGYPVRTTADISEKEAIFEFSLWAFIKPVLSQIKYLEVKESVGVDAEITDIYKKTLAVYADNGYEGTAKIILSTKDRNNVKGVIVLNLYISVRKNVKGFKNIKQYYKKLSRYCVSYSKRDIGAIPPFLVHVRKLEVGNTERLALKEVYSEHGDDVPYATETIATVCPELDLWERGIIDNLSKNPKTAIIGAILKDIKSILKRGEKVILFSKYTTVAEYFGWIVEKVFKVEYGYIHGGLTGKDDVTNIKQDFDEDITDILFLTESGLRGLNLQIANNTICIDMPITAGDLLQLAGRTARLGSEHDLLNMYMYLVGDTITEDLYSLVFGQMALIEEFNPDLLEEGVYDKSVASVALDVDTGQYTRQGLKKRKKLYLK